MQVVVCERGPSSAPPGSCTAECGARQCSHRHFVTRGLTDQLLFLCTETWIGATKLSCQALDHSKEPSQSEVCLFSALSLKPRPEAKRCFYWVDRSKHVCPSCQHPALATLLTLDWWLSLIERTVPSISMKPKDNAVRYEPLKAAHRSSRLIE